MLYINALTKSFYSKDFYRDIILKYKGYCFGYLLLIVFLSNLAATALFVIRGVSAIDEQAETSKIINLLFHENENLSFEQNLNRILNIASQIPDISIKSGILHTSLTDEYKVKDPISGNNIATIDPNDKYSNLTESNSPFLLNKYKMIMADEDVGEYTIYLNKIEQASGFDEDRINQVLNIISQIPLMSVANGQLKTEENKPYFISTADSPTLAIIDTSGEYTSFENNTSYILITTDKILIKNIFHSNSQPKEIKISELDEDTIYGLIYSLIKSIKKILIVSSFTLSLPVLTLASFVFAILFVTTLGFAGTTLLSIYTKNKNRLISYKDCVRLACFAVTPAIFLYTIAPQLFENKTLIYFLISCIYMDFGIRSVLRKN